MKPLTLIALIDQIKTFSLLQIIRNSILKLPVSYINHRSFKQSLFPTVTYTILKSIWKFVNCKPNRLCTRRHLWVEDICNYAAI